MIALLIAFSVAAPAAATAQTAPCGAADAVRAGIERHVRTLADPAAPILTIQVTSPQGGVVVFPKSCNAYAKGQLVLKAPKAEQSCTFRFLTQLTWDKRWRRYDVLNWSAEPAAGSAGSLTGQQALSCS